MSKPLNRVKFRIGNITIITYKRRKNKLTEIYNPIINEWVPLKCIQHLIVNE